MGGCRSRNFDREVDGAGQDAGMDFGGPFGAAADKLGRGGGMRVGFKD